MSQITQVSKLYTFLNNTYIPQFVKFRGNTIPDVCLKNQIGDDLSEEEEKIEN